MLISILTFNGFNEIDSFLALNILGRVRRNEWRVAITSNSPRVTSMNGVVVEGAAPLTELSTADAVIVGSGIYTRDVVNDSAVMQSLRLDPRKQLVGSQCSGALILAKLALLENIPACTDTVTKPWVQEAGVDVLNQPFHASGNIATAGGCLSSHYLAGWIIARLEGIDAAERALHYVAPVGEKEQYVSRAMGHIEKYLPAPQAVGAQGHAPQRLT